MAASSDPLDIHQIIGDVVEPFVPSVNMSLYFEGQNITNGSEIKLSIAVSTPLIVIGGETEEYYTLVMTDPNASTSSKSTQKEWAHWIVTDIPGGSTSSQGREILSYMPPCPTVGIHRYIMILYQQKASRVFLAPPTTRARFSTRLFAHRNNLGQPVSIVYFNTHHEPPSRKRSRNQCN